MPQTSEQLPVIDVAELESTDAGRKAALICRSLYDLKALDIMVLDVQGQTILADYFVIATGTSTTHVQSLGGHVQDEMRGNAFRARPEGASASQWIVMDYGDVILHILGEETREFYDLERLWADAKISVWPDSTPES
jgi:ribosome-associated protein